MDLFQLLQCFDAATKLNLPKQAKRLEKIIDKVTKRLQESMNTPKTKAEPNAETEAKQETAA
jgi:hypothetical protein